MPPHERIVQEWLVERDQSKCHVQETSWPKPLMNPLCKAQDVNASMRERRSRGSNCYYDIEKDNAFPRFMQLLNVGNKYHFQLKAVQELDRNVA